MSIENKLKKAREVFKTHDWVSLIDIYGPYIACKECKTTALQNSEIADHTFTMKGEFLLLTCNESLIKEIIE